MTVKFLSSYSTRPLQMFGGIGVMMGAAGVLICAWVTYQRFFGYQSANRPLLHRRRHAWRSSASS